MPMDNRSTFIDKVQMAVVIACSAIVILMMQVKAKDTKTLERIEAAIETNEFDGFSSDFTLEEIKAILREFE